MTNLTTTSNALSPIDLLKILSHDLRWGIVTTLARSDCKVQELVEQLHQPQNLVSYHLKQLRDSRLLLERRSTADGRDIYYSLDLRHLHAAYAALGLALQPAFTLGATPDAADRTVDLSSADPIRVLFLCTENSARSQMAEAFLRHASAVRLQVYSAGTIPTHIHPLAIQTMLARGLDIRDQRSKSVDEFHGQAFDYVITVCDRAREQCPTFSEATTFIHWSLPDPALVKRGITGAEAQIAAFDHVATTLEIRIHYLIHYLLAASQAKNGVNS